MLPGGSDAHAQLAEANQATSSLAVDDHFNVEDGLQRNGHTSNTYFGADIADDARLHGRDSAGQAPRFAAPMDGLSGGAHYMGPEQATAMRQGARANEPQFSAAAVAPLNRQALGKQLEAGLHGSGWISVARLLRWRRAGPHV